MMVDSLVADWVDGMVDSMVAPKAALLADCESV